MTTIQTLFTPVAFGLALLGGCDSATNSTAVNDGLPNNSDMAASDMPSTSSNGTDPSTEAVTELVPIGDSGARGEVRFVQQGDIVKITGEVTGLQPGKHGFHVHAKGDLSDKQTGKSAGGHFDPTSQPHGKPSDTQRHVGDLGNIEANADGVATIDMQDDVISLVGDNNITGRSLMIHANSDQFTQPTGDAGGRVAFGLIEQVTSTP